MSLIYIPILCSGCAVDMFRRYKAKFNTDVRERDKQLLETLFILAVITEQIGAKTSLHSSASPKLLINPHIIGAEFSFHFLTSKRGQMSEQ